MSPDMPSEHDMSPTRVAGHLSPSVSLDLEVKMNSKNFILIPLDVTQINFNTDLILFKTYLSLFYSAAR